MNIIIVGVLDNPASTNVSMARAFINLGFKVYPVNYRAIIRQYGHQFFDNLVIETVKKYSPVLTIFCKCNGVNPNLIIECNKYTKTWLWNPDPYQTIDQLPEVIQHMINCTYCSHTGGGVNAYYTRRYNLCNSFHIPCGLDYVLYKPGYVTSEYISDISFIGNKTEERDKFRRVLESTKLDVKFYGDGYIKPVYTDEFSKVCSSSKMMLSLNTYNNIPDYFSNRLLRYMGCGTCVLHYDPTETLGKYFKDGEEIILFKDEEELIEKIKDTGEIRGKYNIGKIALNGREKVLKEYTWENTVLRILKVMGIAK